MRPGSLLAPARSPLTLSLQIALVALAHAAAAALAMALNTFHSAGGTTWIPAGVGLAAVLLLGIRVWPGVAIAAFLCNLILGMGVGAAAGVSLANVAGCVIPAVLLRHLDWRGQRLERLDDVLWLMLVGGVLGPLLAAGVGAIALELAGGHDAAGGLRLWLVWGLGNVAGVFIVTPPLLAWLGPPPAIRLRSHAADLFGIGLGLVALTVLTKGVTPYYALAAFPIVAWAALRLGPRGVTAVVLMIVVLVGWSANEGGVMVGASRTALVTFITAVQLAYVVTGLLLAATSAEREHSRAVAQASGERFTLLASATDDLFYEWDPGTNVDWWNANLQTMLGYESAEVQPGGRLAWSTLVHPEDRDRVLPGYYGAIAGNAVIWRDEYQLRRQDGHYIWVLDRAHILRDGQG